MGAIFPAGFPMGLVYGSSVERRVPYLGVPELSTNKCSPPKNLSKIDAAAGPAVWSIAFLVALIIRWTCGANRALVKWNHWFCKVWMGRKPKERCYGWRCCIIQPAKGVFFSGSKIDHGTVDGNELSTLVNVGMDQSWAPIVTAKSRLVGEHQSNFTVVYSNYMQLQHSETSNNSQYFFTNIRIAAGPTLPWMCRERWCPKKGMVKAWFTRHVLSHPLFIMVYDGLCFMMVY